jgi:hypothetical protein
MKYQVSQPTRAIAAGHRRPLRRASVLSRPIALVGLLALAGVASADDADAQPTAASPHALPEVAIDADAVRIRAEAPLPEVLRALAHAADVDLELPRRADEAQPIRVSVDGLTVQAAFELLLEGASYSLVADAPATPDAGTRRLRQVRVLSFASARQRQVSAGTPDMAPQTREMLERLRRSGAAPADAATLSPAVRARIDAAAAEAAAAAAATLPEMTQRPPEGLSKSVGAAVREQLLRNGFPVPAEAP